jgi:putative CocE/NonD family hydrolase
VERDVDIVMPDGVVLRADVWRPQSSEARPALLQRTPYNKSDSYLTSFHSALEPLRATAAGYVVVIQDVRGRFASEGAFDPFVNEEADGRATIEWLRAQPYCNGQVALYGVSYVGATQLLAAVSGAAGVFACAPHQTAVDYYDGWTHQGGAFQLGFSLMWAIALADSDLARRAGSGEDVAELRFALEPYIANPEGAFELAPPTSFVELIRIFPAYERWLCEPPTSSYWLSVSLRERIKALDLPALHVGGWHDLFLAGTLSTFSLMSKHMTEETARSRQRLIVGPWAHALPLQWIGSIDYGPAAGQPTLDMTAVHLGFFEEALSDPTPAESSAPVRLFVMGANEWRDFELWPPSSITYQHWYLQPGGGLKTDAPESPAAPSRFVYDPANPVPTCGGSTFLPGLFVGSNAGPRDQRAVEARDDVLIFTSDILSRPLEVIGPLRVEIYAASSAPDTDWTAKLVDVHPDGSAYNVADGILRARYRKRLDSPSMIEPGRIYRYNIDLIATAQRFEPGHRVRVHISSSNFPRFDRNPNTGGDIAKDGPSAYRVARQAVFHDHDHPSSLVLPVLAPASG